MADPALIVMAAGIGSRYGGAKQIESVGPSGEIVVSYAVYDALEAGFTRIVFVIRKEMEAVFRERLGKAVEARADTAYVFQALDDIPDGCEAPRSRVKPWGTCHAVLCCKDAVAGPFAVINADDYYGTASYKMLCDYLRGAKDGPQGYDFSLVGFSLDKTLSPHGPVSRGVCAVGPDGFLVAVDERRKVRKSNGDIQYEDDDGEWVTVAPDAIASMNIWGFTPGLFGELENRFRRFLMEHKNDPKAEFLLPVLGGTLVKEGRARVKVLATDETWLGVTYKRDLSVFRGAIREHIAQGRYPEVLWRPQCGEGAEGA